MEKYYEQALDIANSILTIDGHFDLNFDLLSRRQAGETQVVKNRYLDSFRNGGISAVVSAIFIENHFLPEQGLRQALDQISALYADCDETPDTFTICTSMAEADRAKELGKLAIFMSLEGAEPIGNDPYLLRIFYELGVRGLGLVWSRPNHVADGYLLRSDGQVQHDGGLTNFGYQLVEMAEELGMVIDVSHLADNGFNDLLKVSKKPFLASHSNCRSLASHGRNLTDEQIRAIADKGGTIGMNAIRLFIDDNQNNASISKLADHADHVVKIGGIDSLAIGFDLCDQLKDPTGTPFTPGLETSDLLKGHNELPFFIAELLKRNYIEKDIKAVLGNNLKRVYQDCGC